MTTKAINTTYYTIYICKDPSSLSNETMQINALYNPHAPSKPTSGILTFTETNHKHVWSINLDLKMMALDPHNCDNFTE